MLSGFAPKVEAIRMPASSVYRAECPECSWDRTTITREQAEHAKRVHEDWVGHSGILIKRVE